MIEGVFSAYVFSTSTLSERSKSTGAEKPRASCSQTTNGPAFECGNTKEETEKEEGNESDMGAGGEGGVCLHAEAAGGSCWLVFLM